MPTSVTTYMKPDIKVIAEIGCNHRGDLGTAKEMIRIAAKICGADIAKFQKRNPRELLPSIVYEAPHAMPEHAYGPTYGAHREFLEFDVEQHKELVAECSANGIGYATSVWDMTSTREITALGPPMIKVPSATNQNFAVQGYLAERFAGEIHVSTGMTTPAEVDRIVNFYAERGRSDDLVLYACTSGYPVAFEDVCLLEINRLQERHGDRLKAVGFSGHHLGIAADVAAMTVGSLGERRYGRAPLAYVERHFTLDRTWKGTDHAASLEPDGLRRLCRDLANVRKALAFKERELLPVEEPQRRKLKWLPADDQSQCRGPGS